MLRTTFKDNRAQSGPPVAGDGGGLWALRYSDVQRSTFVGNHADGEGGGLWSQTWLTSFLMNVTFNANDAHTGGALGTWSTDLRANGNTLFSNTAGVASAIMAHAGSNLALGHSIVASAPGAGG